MMATVYYSPEYARYTPQFQPRQNEITAEPSDKEGAGVPGPRSRDRAAATGTGGSGDALYDEEIFKPARARYVDDPAEKGAHTEPESATRPAPDAVTEALAALDGLGWPVIREAGDYSLEPYFGAHDSDLVEFYREYERARGGLEVGGAAPAPDGLDTVPSVFVPRALPAVTATSRILKRRIEVTRRPLRRPASLAGRLGWYCQDTFTPLVPGFWAAACGTLSATISAAHQLAEGRRFVCVLAQPSGVHAGYDYFGGGSFLNHAAAATRFFARRVAVAVLHIGPSHANGTQDIFYADREVLTVSVHGDPARHYPFFSGFGDERGAGRGEGFNVNLPIAFQAEALAGALDEAGRTIRKHKPAVLIVTYDSSLPARCAGDADELSRSVAAAVGGCAVPTLLIHESDVGAHFSAASFRIVASAIADAIDA